MSEDLIAVVLAVCSAVCIALGAALRQHSAGAEEDAGGSVLRAPAWWLGIGTGLAGFGFQAAALAFGPILLVQPVLVTSLLFMLPLGRAVNGVRPTAGQWAWASALTCAVAVLVVLADPRPGGHRFAERHWAITAVAALVLIGAAVWAVGYSRGRTRAIALGVVSGGLFGIVAVLTKTVATHLHHRGTITALAAAESIALVVVAAAAFLVQHLSYRAGELRASFPAALLAEQAVAAVLGVLALGESIAPGAVQTVVLVAGVVFACVAVLRLATVDAPG